MIEHVLDVTRPCWCGTPLFMFLTNEENDFIYGVRCHSQATWQFVASAYVAEGAPC